MEAYQYDRIGRADSDTLYEELRQLVNRDAEIQATFPAARGLVNEIGAIRQELQKRGLPACISELGW